MTDGQCCFQAQTPLHWLVPCICTLVLGCASGACSSTGGPAHEHTTLAALCYSDSTARSYDKTGQLCISPTFLWPTPWTQINPRAPLNHLPLRTPYLPTCALHQDLTYTETVFLSLPLFTCCALRLHSEIIILLRAGLIPLCQMLLSGSAGFRSATRLQLFGT